MIFILDYLKFSGFLFELIMHFLYFAGIICY